MIVAFDTSPLVSGHQGRGVGTYTRGLMSALKHTKTNFKLVFTPNPKSAKPDLVHYPYFDLFFHTLPLKKSAKTIVTVHDVIPLAYPKQFPRGLRGSLKLSIQKASLKGVSAIITDSLASKKDITKYLNIKPDKIHPILLAAASSFQSVSQKRIDQFKKKHSLPGKFFSYVGDVNYNKNLPLLIKAVGQVKEATLVIVTRANVFEPTKEAQTHLAYNSIKSAISNLDSPDQVKFISIDSQSELNTLYCASHFYIQPSLREGFGLPILEAMQSGTPVLSSNTSSLPEVAGDAAIYFNPTNPKEISSTITKVLSFSPTKRKALVTKSLNHAKNFSWKKTSRETIAVYQSVLNH